MSFHIIPGNTISLQIKPCNFIPYCFKANHSTSFLFAMSIQITPPYSISYFFIPHEYKSQHVIPYQYKACQIIPYQQKSLHIIPHHAIPCNSISIQVTPCHSTWYRNIPHHSRPYHIIPYDKIPFHTIWTINSGAIPNSLKASASFHFFHSGSSFCNGWYWTPVSAVRKHLQKTSQKHKTNFSDISKTPTKLLKQFKDTKQSSQTSQRHRTNISNTSNCVTKGSHTCTSWWNWLSKVL